MDWKDPLEKETAAHSNILAWKIPWTEEPGRTEVTVHGVTKSQTYQSTHTNTHTEIKMVQWIRICLSLQGAQV